MDDLSPTSPEARLKEAALAQAEGREHPEEAKQEPRWWTIVKRVAIGTFNDGFIHAGNLAYLAILSIFPFIIVALAVAQIVGTSEGGLRTMQALLNTMPANVADVLRGPLTDVIQARSGSLLWLGGILALWSVGSFIETIRDIIRRAYGVKSTHPFWEYRLASAGLIIVAVLAILLSFSVSLALSSAQRFITDLIPGTDQVVGLLTLFRFVPALVLFGALFLLFYSLTPGRYRHKSCPKWPGALFVAIWWVLTAALLPAVISGLGGYDATYGSLAGVAIALLFFYLVGIGVVIGAEVNAALAETPTPSQEDVAAAVQEKKADEAHEAAREAAGGDAEQDKAGTGTGVVQRDGESADARRAERETT